LMHRSKEEAIFLPVEYDPANAQFILDNILTDENLHSLWKHNEGLITGDLEHYFTPIERDNFLYAKTMCDDILAMLGGMGREERMELLEGRGKLYLQFTKFMGVVSALEEKAMIRKGNDPRNKPPVENPFGDLAEAHLKTKEGEEVHYERKKPTTFDAEAK